MRRRLLLSGSAVAAVVPLLLRSAGRPTGDAHSAAAAATSAPFGRGRTAARVLEAVIEGSAWAGCRLPAGAAHALAGVGGTAEWALRPAKRARLARNLAHAIGRGERESAVRRLVLAEVRNEARRSADLLWALGDRAAVRASTAIEGREHMVEALAEGRGAILAGTHLGGWEIAASISEDAIPGAVTAVVADNWLAWAMEKRRRAVGLRTVKRHEAARGAARALRDGGTVLLLGDDSWGGTARVHPVRFLDGVAELPAGIVTLARLCGSPIVPFTFLPDGPRRWRGRFEPAIAPPGRAEGVEGEQRVLQLLAERWSAAIERAPEHWAASFRIRWVES
ncbi:MAG: hypothetical protein FJW96_06555 [Actinobacteria bacterium]|nr:hypothetical protein [Actinomycetota bacterium]